MIDLAAASIPVGTLIIAGAAVFVSSRSVRSSAEANAFNAVMKELEISQKHSERQDKAIKTLEDEVSLLKTDVANCESQREEDREAHASELLVLYRKLNALEEGRNN